MKNIHYTDHNENSMQRTRPPCNVVYFLYLLDFNETKYVNTKCDCSEL